MRIVVRIKLTPKLTNEYKRYATQTMSILWRINESLAEWYHTVGYHNHASQYRYVFILIEDYCKLRETFSLLKKIPFLLFNFFYENTKERELKTQNVCVTVN